MKQFNNIKGIIFDYGGTIDTNGKHWAEVLWSRYKELNIPVSKEDFKKDVELIKFLLNEDKFEFEKVEVEYAIYDTNVNHDAKWILS